MGGTGIATVEVARSSVLLVQVLRIRLGSQHSHQSWQSMTPHDWLKPSPPPDNHHPPITAHPVASMAATYLTSYPTTKPCLEV